MNIEELVDMIIEATKGIESEKEVKRFILSVINSYTNIKCLRLSTNVANKLHAKILMQQYGCQKVDASVFLEKLKEATSEACEGVEQ